MPSAQLTKYLDPVQRAKTSFYVRWLVRDAFIWTEPEHDYKTTFPPGPLQASNKPGPMEISGQGDPAGAGGEGNVTFHFYKVLALA